MSQASDDQALLDALMGKTEGSIVDQVDAALTIAWRLSTGLNLPLPSSGGAPGPFRPGGATIDLAADQTSSRWGGASKARTLPEKTELLSALVAGIAAARRNPAARPPAPTTPAPAPTTPAPAPTSPAPVPEGGGLAQKYRTTYELPYGSFPVGDGGWIATQGCWGSSARQIIETVGRNGFRVVRAEHNKPGGVAAYPSVYSGAAWASGAGKGWRSTRVADLANLQTSASISLPVGPWKGNAGAYDLWFDRDPGKHDDLELMIWMHTEGVSPAGVKVGTIRVGDASWTVWSGVVGGTPVLSYVRMGSTLFLDHLPLAPFMEDAKKRGRLGAEWFLTSPQIGAELWVGGAGFALNSWAFG